MIKALKSYAVNIFFKYGYSLSKIGHNNLFSSMVYYHFRKNKDLFFLQIGANDGKSFDPIFFLAKHLRLKGIALEPINEYFQELSKNYSGTKVLPVNYAIYYTNTELAMYKVKKTEFLPVWSKGIASINSEHHKKSGIDLSSMEAVKVKAITFETLFEQYDVRNIDILQIDTEGYDYELIKLFPFDKMKPKIINFEHGLKDEIMSKKQFIEIVELLVGYGYSISMDNYDCLAYLK